MQNLAHRRKGGHLESDSGPASHIGRDLLVDLIAELQRVGGIVGLDRRQLGLTAGIQGVGQGICPNIVRASVGGALIAGRVAGNQGVVDITCINGGSAAGIAVIITAETTVARTRMPRRFRAPPM
jgi:hypothetical protein